MLLPRRGLRTRILGIDASYQLMFQVTRRRLALWYTAVTAVLLLLFASGMYLCVRSTLIERIDDTLNQGTTFTVTLPLERDD